MSDLSNSRGFATFALVSMALLTACSYTPHRAESPRLEMPAKFMNETGLTAQQVLVHALPDEWWRAYGDPQIDALVSEALEHNTDLAVARARIDEAVAITRRARASMLPSLALTPRATRARDYSLGSAITSDARLPLSASWEVDLAGRLSHAADGAMMDAVAVEQSWLATRWQIAFETVTAALQQRQATELEDLAKKRLQVAERLQRLTEQKFDAGQVTGFDIERTRSEVVAIRVEQEQLRSARGEATHALDVLVGRIPGATGTSPALASLNMPDWTPQSVPGDLLKRRPDVRAAQARLAAATARWNAAEGERFPKLVLDLSGGRQRFENNGTRVAGNIFSLGLGVTLPILDGGAIQAGIDEGSARSRGAQADLKRTLLLALQDVENAYLGWQTQRASLQHQAEGLAVADRLLDRSRRLFEAGQVDATVVAEAERGTLSQQAALIRARAETAAKWGVLAKALSGSPEHANPEGAACKDGTSLTASTTCPSPPASF